MIKTIIHIADVHIRLVQRHKEYRAVFNKLYRNLKNYDKDTTLVVLAGDIVHSKLEMSPELIVMTVNFLTKLASRHRVLMIPGNHDANLSNPNRLDALSSIIHAIEASKVKSNIIYVKDTCNFTIDNLGFTHYSVFDDKDISLFPDIEELPKEVDTRIALYHGPVNKAETDTGYSVDREHMTVKLFEPYDITLLGDIHKRQFLNTSNSVLYPGSLIQQNYGETVDKHGYAIWNVEDRTAKFVDIPNDYAHCTVTVRNGIIEGLNSIKVKHPKVRVLSENTSDADLRKAIPVIKKALRVREVAFRKTTSTHDRDLDLSKVNLTDVRDVNFQNRLLAEYLEDLDSATRNEVLNINHEINLELPSRSFVRNITWKPKRFEFSNMFSYGPNNVVDFTNMGGLYGLFANNAAGKTSILEALLYCCFDKCSKTNKAGAILNSKSKSFSCTFTFELEGRDYTIHRNGSIQRYTGHVKVDVDFWTYDKEGKKIILNGTERDSTNRIIRDYIGTYEEIILTSFSLQTDAAAFIDVPQRKRKEFLSKFLDLEVFEDLNIIAKQKYSDIQALLRELKRESRDFNLAELSEREKALETTIKDWEDRSKRVQTEIRKKSAEELTLTKKYKPLDVAVRKLKVDDLKINKRNLEKSLTGLLDEISSNEYTLSDSENIQQLIEEETRLKAKLIEDRKIHEKLIKARDDHRRTLLEHQSILEKFEGVSSRIEELEEMDFDPNCSFCYQRNSSEAKLLEDLYEKKKTIQTQVGEKWLEHSQLEELLKNSKQPDLQDTEHKLNAILGKKSSLERLKSTLERQSMQKIILESDINTLNFKIEQYCNNQEAIEFNRKIHDEIEQTVVEKKRLEDLLDKVISTLDQEKTSLTVLQTRIVEYVTKIEKLEKLEKENISLRHYIDATKRDAIPYKIISDIIPILEEEVNNILMPIVKFSISLEADGKNINAKVYYDDESQWPVELSSGMERFLIQLAIRNALINISTLPKPNFVVVDEGWGTLSYENITNMGPLMDMLKMNYEFAIIISHVDSMRDMVDRQITIQKQDGMSKVIYADS